MFKPGDKVKCIYNKGIEQYFSVSQICTVQSVTFDPIISDYILVINGPDNEELHVRSVAFEPYEETLPNNVITPKKLRNFMSSPSILRNNINQIINQGVKVFGEDTTIMYLEDMVHRLKYGKSI